MTNSNTIDIYDRFSVDEVLQRIPKPIAKRLINYALSNGITIENVKERLQKRSGNEFYRRLGFYNLVYEFIVNFYANFHDQERIFLKRCGQYPIQVILQVTLPDFPSIKPKLSLRDWYCRNARYHQVIGMFQKRGFNPDEDDFQITVI